MPASLNDQMTVDRFRDWKMESVIVVLSVTFVALLVTQASFLVAALFVILGIATIFNFDLFVYATIFLLPWYPLVDWDLPVRDISLVLRFVLLAGVWIARLKKGKSIKDWMIGGFLKKAVVLFAVVAVVSLLASPMRSNVDAYRALARLFSYLAVFFGLAGWLETREQISNLIKLLLLSTIAVAVFGFYQAYVGGYTDLYFHIYPTQEEALEPWVGRITSFLFHYNSLAGYLNLVIPFGITALVLAKKKSLRYLGGLCLAMSPVALFLTQSRGGLLAFGAALFVCIWFLARKMKTRILVFSVAALILVISVTSLVQYSDRLQNVDQLTELSRLALWGAAGSMFFSHPILGVGYGNYRSLYNDYIPGITPGQLDAHNLYLQFLAETGIIGFLCLLVLMGALLWMGFKLARDMDPFVRLVGIGVCGALAATLIHGLVDFLFNTSPQFGALFWMVAALGAVTLDMTRKQQVDDRVVTSE